MIESLLSVQNNIKSLGEETVASGAKIKQWFMPPKIQRYIK